MPRGRTTDTNISLEAKRNYKSLYNFDTFKDAYKIKAVVELENGRISARPIIFVDLNMPFMEMHKHYLLARSDIIEFTPRWINRPNYLSYDMYGTTSFAPLLLFLNNKISFLDFDFDYVVVPRISAIKELIISNQRLYPDRTKIKDIKFS
jgi:hypothetical protein